MNAIKRCNWYNYCFYLGFFAILSFFIFGCAYHKPNNSLPSHDYPLQKQFKLTFKPDREGTSFTEKEILEFLEKAKSTGLELDYQVHIMDQDSGKIMFIKKLAESNYSVKIDVQIDVMHGRQLTYVYITASSGYEIISASAISEFKKRYTSKFD